MKRKKEDRPYFDDNRDYVGELENENEKNSPFSMSDIPLEVCESSSNNTEINNTDISNNNPILSGNNVDNDMDKDMDERNAYREYLMEQLSMDILYERYPFEKETLEAIMDVLSQDEQWKEGRTVCMRQVRQFML